MASDTELLSLLPRKTSLRTRVMVFCAALGGAIGVCLAFVAEHIAVKIEHVLIREEMLAEIDTQIAQHGNDPDAKLPRTAWKSVYFDRPGQPATSPPELRNLPEGVHEVDDPNNDRFVAVSTVPIGRVTLVGALPISAARARRFSEELFAMVLLGILLGAWLGRMLAGSMLAPVLRLSHQVDSAEPTTELRDLAQDHRADEVGALANAFIRYHVRVQAAIEREILFSADASHELRTPLSVLQGALDLLDGQTIAPPARRKIERMRRSALEIGMLLDALLLIARPDGTLDATGVTVELGPALASVIAEFHDELDAAGIEIGLRCPASVRVLAPPQLLRVALRLLFRAIASGAWGDRLRLDADASGIVLALAGPIAPDLVEPDVVEPDVAETDIVDVTAGDATATVSADLEPSGAANAPAAQIATGGSASLRSDETGGIGMLRRLCERYNWRLEIPQDAHQEILLRLRIASPGVSAS